MGWLSQVFELNHAGLNWPRAVLLLDVVMLPLVVFWAIGYEQYLLSAVFGVLLPALADPGGAYSYRATQVSLFAAIGAGLTALAFGIGGAAWGWLVLAGVAVTLLAGLAITFGAHRFVTALLLNLWFLVALSLAFGLHHHSRISSYTWAQVVSWIGGSALWLVVSFVEWLIRGRADRAPIAPEFPGETKSRKLTGPLIMFAVIRAVAIGGAVAIAFGLDLSHASWMPIAALVAMKPSLEQSKLVAAQRVAGALIGAAIAVLLLLIPASEHGLKLFSVNRALEVVAIILLMHGAAIRFVNYAIYCAAIAAGVLIFADLPQPSNYSAEGDRVLWTLCGVGIGLIVMFLAELMGRRRAKASPQPDRRSVLGAGQRPTRVGSD